MAHGGRKNGYFEVRDGKEMDIETVMNYFGTRNCPALRDKPKIFLINTCRGNEDGHATQSSSSASYVANEADIGGVFSSSMFDDCESDSGRGVRNILQTIRTGASRLSFGGPEDTSSTSPLPSGSDDPESENAPTSPNSAGSSARRPTNLSFMHTILAFSTLKNFISWRSNVVGTVFIVSLLDILRDHFATMDVYKILQLTGNRVLELSNNGQAIEIRTIACLQDIYLVPNTSLEVKQWLQLGCDDTTAVVLTPYHIERQARHLFAKGYTDVKHLVKDGKIKFTSAVSLESVGIEPLHTVYLFARIHGTRFVPTVLGALAALQHIVYLAEVNPSFMKEEVLLKVVKEAFLCLANCIVPYNLSAFSAHRQTLLTRVRHRRAVLIDDYAAIAHLMVRVGDFRGMGLVGRLSAHHARLLAECGAVRCILNTIQLYQQPQQQEQSSSNIEEQQGVDVPSWVRGGKKSKKKQQSIAGFFKDKVAGFENRHLVVQELLYCLRHACTNKDTIKRLCDTDPNSGLTLTNTLRRTRGDPIDRDLFFSSLSIAHIMVTEHRAVSKGNREPGRKYVQDLMKHIHSSESHPQTQVTLSKLAQMMAVSQRGVVHSTVRACQT
eukprot:gene26435-33013_t